MVIFKRASKLATTTSSRNPDPVDTERARNGTTRYSDIAAGRQKKYVPNATPIQRLLDTFELCEQVLDYLPMEDVLHFTRVCRAFKDNIEGSRLLQAKLFLAPDRTLKKLAVSPKGTLLAGHRAEQQISAATSANEGADIANSGRQVETGEISLYNPHPYLRTDRLSDRHKRMGIVRYAKVCLESRHSEVRSGTSMRDLSAATAVPADSSFYRMLISQPPAGEVTIRLPFRSDHGSQIFSLRSMKVRNKLGVTMGDILHTIHHASDMDNIPPYMKCVDIFFPRGFAANERARKMAEEAGELSTQDDLTCWQLEDDRYVLKEGGFEFW